MDPPPLAGQRIGCDNLMGRETTQEDSTLMGRDTAQEGSTLEGRDTIQVESPLMGRDTTQEESTLMGRDTTQEDITLMRRDTMQEDITTLMGRDIRVDDSITLVQGQEIMQEEDSSNPLKGRDNVSQVTVTGSTASLSDILPPQPIVKKITSLTVNILLAINLPYTDVFNSLGNPYCEIVGMLANGNFIPWGKTRIKHQTQNPIWNETFDLKLPRHINSIVGLRFYIIDAAAGVILGMCDVDTLGAVSGKKIHWEGDLVGGPRKKKKRKHKLPRFSMEYIMSYERMPSMSYICDQMEIPITRVVQGVKVTIVSATNTKTIESVSGQLPVCQVWARFMDGSAEQIYTTKVANSENPVWDETFTYDPESPIDNPIISLWFKVFDMPRKSRRDQRRGGGIVSPVGSSSPSHYGDSPTTSGGVSLYGDHQRRMGDQQSSYGLNEYEGDTEYIVSTKKNNLGQGFLQLNKVLFGSRYQGQVRLLFDLTKSQMDGKLKIKPTCRGGGVESSEKPEVTMATRFQDAKAKASTLLASGTMVVSYYARMLVAPARTLVQKKVETATKRISEGTVIKSLNASFTKALGVDEARAKYKKSRPNSVLFMDDRPVERKETFIEGATHETKRYSTGIDVLVEVFGQFQRVPHWELLKKREQIKWRSRPTEEKWAEPYVVYICGEVISARELEKTDVWGLSDPYCKVAIQFKEGNEKEDIYETRIIQNDLNPIWKEKFEWTAQSSAKRAGRILFSVYDSDVGEQAETGGDDFLGCASVWFKDVDLFSGVEEEIPLSGMKKKLRWDKATGRWVKPDKKDRKESTITVSLFIEYRLRVGSNVTYPEPPEKWVKRNRHRLSKETEYKWAGKTSDYQDPVLYKTIDDSKQLYAAKVWHLYQKGAFSNLPNKFNEKWALEVRSASCPHQIADIDKLEFPSGHLKNESIKNKVYARRQENDDIRVPAIQKIGLPAGFTELPHVNAMRPLTRSQEMGLR